MKITVIGFGDVGSLSGACLTELGNDSIRQDLDPRNIVILQQGGVPIYEPDLEEVINSAVSLGHLHFTTDCGKHRAWLGAEGEQVIKVLRDMYVPFQQLLTANGEGRQVCFAHPHSSKERGTNENTRIITTTFLQELGINGYYTTGD